MVWMAGRGIVEIYTRPVSLSDQFATCIFLRLRFLGASA